LILGKPSPNWIEKNVISLFAKAFFLAKTVFEEIALSFNLQNLGSPFLPFAHNYLNAFFRVWKREQ